MVWTRCLVTSLSTFEIGNLEVFYRLIFLAWAWISLMRSRPRVKSRRNCSNRGSPALHTSHIRFLYQVKLARRWHLKVFLVAHAKPRPLPSRAVEAKIPPVVCLHAVLSWTSTSHLLGLSLSLLESLCPGLDVTAIEKDELVGIRPFLLQFIFTLKGLGVF